MDPFLRPCSSGYFFVLFLCLTPVYAATWSSKYCTYERPANVSILIKQNLIPHRAVRRAVAISLLHRPKFDTLRYGRWAITTPYICFCKNFTVISFWSLRANFSTVSFWFDLYSLYLHAVGIVNNKLAVSFISLLSSSFFEKQKSTLSSLSLKFLFAQLN